MRRWKSWSALSQKGRNEYPHFSIAGGWAKHYKEQAGLTAAAIEMAKRELAELLELK